MATPSLKVTQSPTGIPSPKISSSLKATPTTNPKADLHQWSVLNKAVLVYNTYEVEKPTPKEKFVSVLNVKTLPENDFIPSLDVVYTSAACPSKRASEGDVAAVALEQLLKLDPFSRFDPLDNILLACAHAVKDPAKSSAFKIVNLLIEAFDADEVGWMNYDAFLLFPTVQSAINKANSANSHSPTESSMCLRTAFMKLVGYERVATEGKTPLDLASQVLDVDAAEGHVRVRRRMFITNKEFLFMQVHNARIVEQKLVSEYDKLQIMNIEQICSLHLLHMHEQDVTDADVTIASKHSMLSALQRIREILGIDDMAISRPLFYTSRKTHSRDDKASGPRLFCGMGSAGQPLNKVASWIYNGKIYGDTVLANVSVGMCENVDRSVYFNILASSLPSGLWIKGEILVLLLFPDVFLMDMWSRVPRSSSLCIEPIASHLPMQVLEEFVVRRAGQKLLVQKEQFGDLAAAGDVRALSYIAHCKKVKHDTRLLSEEKLPRSALWNGALDGAEIDLPTRQSEPRGVAEVNEVGVVRLSVPSAAFFMQDGESKNDGAVVTFIAEVPGSSYKFTNSYHMQYALQYCAFQALCAIEQHGQHALFGVDRQYRSDVKIESSVHLGEVAATECFYDFVEFQLSAMGYSGVFSAYLGTGMLPPSLDRAIQSLTEEDCITELMLNVTELPFKTWPFEYSSLYDNHLSCIIKLLTQHKRVTPLTLQIKEKRQYQIFNPPLQAQRCSLVTALLRSQRATSWLDVGCGEGQMLLATATAAPNTALHCPALQYAAGLDPNRQKLQRARAAYLQTTCGHSPSDGKTEISREFYTGSGSELRGSPLSKRAWDVVTCMEVIEHMASVDDAVQLAVAALGLRPQYAVFSTPNKEANVLIRAASQGMLSKDEKIEPTYQDEKFRHYDHHFEFTRAQFTDWCEKVLRLARADYSIEYTTLGNLLPQMGRTVLVDGTVFEGYGGATQVAVFCRSSQEPRTDGGNSSEGNISLEWKI